MNVNTLKTDNVNSRYFIFQPGNVNSCYLFEISTIQFKQHRIKNCNYN